jgi:predicted site-specific integrase-resolvase
MSNHTPLAPAGHVFREQAAGILGVSYSTLGRFVRDGKIKKYFVDGYWPCYRVAQLDRLAARRTKARSA